METAILYTLKKNNYSICLHFLLNFFSEFTLHDLHG